MLDKKFQHQKKKNPNRLNTDTLVVTGPVIITLQGLIALRFKQNGQRLVDETRKAVKPGLDWTLDSGLDYGLDWTRGTATFGYRDRDG